MEQIKINDESGDKKYFSQLPNIVLNHSTATDQALYWQMKRFAGENGKCFATQETLRKKLGIGKQAYNKSLNYLLSKNWIKYDGLTNGKTRPIKTYSIVDIWKLNIMEYEKISPEMAISFNEEISPKTEGDKSQNGNKISPRMAIEEEPTIRITNKNIIATVPVADNLNPLIELFKEINPSYEQLFRNKTQRGALSRLLKKLGREKLERAIEFAGKANTMPFAPTITTPLQLEEKMGALIAFFQKENNKSNKVITI